MNETNDTTPIAADEAGLTPYSQRQQLMALACTLAIRCGMRAGRYHDPVAEESRYADVLHIDLPTGQVTIHVDSEDPNQSWMRLPLIDRTWDGHSQGEAFAAVGAFVHRAANDVDAQAREQRVGARLFGTYMAAAAELHRKADELEAASVSDVGRQITSEVCEALRARAKQMESGTPSAGELGQLDIIAGMVDCDPGGGDVLVAVLNVVREMEAARIEAARLREALAQAQEESQRTTLELVELREVWTQVADRVERVLAAEVTAYSNRLDIVGALQRVAASIGRP